MDWEEEETTGDRRRDNRLRLRGRRRRNGVIKFHKFDRGDDDEIGFDRGETIRGALK